MDLFGKKQFEELDFVTQLVEPFNDYLIDIYYTKLPNKIILNIKDILTIDDWWDKTQRVIEQAIKQHFSEEELLKINVYDLKFLNTLFKIEYIGPLRINVSSKSLEGEIYIIKNEEVDEKLYKKRIQHLVDQLSRNFKYMLLNQEIDTNRFNQVADIIACPEALTKRVVAFKQAPFMNRIKDIFQNDEWRIRDIYIVYKIFDWMSNFIAHGNLAAMTNFCKLKVMTYSRLPIYKIEETI